jgi:hypothetical protein
VTDSESRISSYAFHRWRLKDEQFKLAAMRLCRLVDTRQHFGGLPPKNVCNGFSAFRFFFVGNLA